jgi:hypothetical protein
MKIKILQDTCIYGVPAYVGAVVDATDLDANYLINLGKAEIVKDEPAPPIVEAPAKRKPRTKVTPDGNLSTNA